LKEEEERGKNKKRKVILKNPLALGFISRFFVGKYYLNRNLKLFSKNNFKTLKNLPNRF
jgi:hypothetical protein